MSKVPAVRPVRRTTLDLVTALRGCRAWRAHAAEKLRLLGRLAALTGDTETERRLAELAAARGSSVCIAAPPPD